MAPQRSGTHNLERKRVAMVVFSYYKFDPRPRRAAEALAALGMHVELISLREDKHAPRREMLNGVAIRRVSIKRRRGGFLAYVYQYLAFLLTVSAIIAVRGITRRFDLVYVHNMPDFLVLSGLIPKMLGAKVILDLHDPMPELMRTIHHLPEDATSVRLMKVIEKWSLALADSIITVNNGCAKLFASRSCSPQKISVVMNSPDEKIFKLRPPSTKAEHRAGKPFVIMYHGSLVERNGLELAVQALALLHPVIPTAQLQIYGARNAFFERVMESVRRLGLESAVHYKGSKSIEEIAQAIQECDVGIVPNQRNIFTELNTPTRIFEYLAMGKPVIAPLAPGITDYFDNNSLVFFELGDAEDLARKIRFVFDERDRVLEIIRRGQQVYRAHAWAEERLSLTGVVAKLLDSSSAEAEPVGTLPQQTGSEHSTEMYR